MYMSIDIIHGEHQASIHLENNAFSTLMILEPREYGKGLCSMAMDINEVDNLIRALELLRDDMRRAKRHLSP